MKRTGPERKAAERKAESTNLFIEGLTTSERHELCARVPYCGIGDDYIATVSRHLALAIVELLDIRKRRRAQIQVLERGLVLTAKKSRV